MPALIDPIGLDQRQERLVPDGELRKQRGEPGHGRVSGLAGAGPGEFGLHPIQCGRTVAAVLVADVVHQAGEPVDGQQVRPGARRYDSQHNRKVLTSPLGHDRVQIEPDFGMHNAPRCGSIPSLGPARRWTGPSSIIKSLADIPRSRTIG